MRYLLAPMEGITGYVFRNAYHSTFDDFDEYITPFLSPTTDCVISPKELKEIEPDHNRGMNVIPQIITNRASLFVETAKYLQQQGYGEVNLNLGCPSPTVVSKRKGAGVLQSMKHVRDILEGIAKECPLPFSVKTRVGFQDTQDFTELLSVFRDYPLTELIIHPRTRTDFYKGPIHEECVFEALNTMTVPIVYNGDIFEHTDCEMRINQYAGLDGVMLGRGVAANPFLLLECKRKERVPEQEYRRRLQEFLDALLDGYAAILHDDTTTLFRLKELWSYLCNSFESIEKQLKRIRKTTSVAEYRILVKDIVQNGKRK